MDPDLDHAEDALPEGNWGRACLWEDHWIDEFAKEREVVDQQSKLEQEAAGQQLWQSFQNSATAVTNLYKDSLEEENCWFPFQNAAGAVTILYKDAMEVQKKAYERGLQLGYNKKMRDVVMWAKKKRRHIRRDELIAYMCGKSPPVKTQRHSPPRSKHTHRSHGDRGSPVTPVPRVDKEPDLTPFQNALAIQGLDGAMSSFSMGYSSSVKTKSDELNRLIMDELSRQNETRKRSNSRDTSLDIPRKRSRFLSKNL